MGRLEASCILAPGRPDRQNGASQKSKILDFAQNDFGGVSDNFPGITFKWVKKFFLRTEIFSQKTHRKHIFELPLRMIGLLMGIYQHGSDFFPIRSKMAEWRSF